MGPHLKFAQLLSFAYRKDRLRNLSLFYRVRDVVCISDANRRNNNLTPSPTRRKKRKDWLVEENVCF